MTPEQKAELTAASRISEIEGRWTMTQTFFLIHSGLFSLVLTQFKPGALTHLGTCFLGIWLAIIWLGATRRSRALIAFWENKLAALEAVDGEQLIRVFSVQPPETAGVRIGTVLNFLVGTFIGVWGALLSISLPQFVNIFWRNLP